MPWRIGEQVLHTLKFDDAADSRLAGTWDMVEAIVHASLPPVWRFAQEDPQPTPSNSQKGYELKNRIGNQALNALRSVHTVHTVSECRPQPCRVKYKSISLPLGSVFRAIHSSCALRFQYAFIGPVTIYDNKPAIKTR